MNKSILFVINNFNIGGPQKSLLSLLYKLDYKKYNIDLLILNGEGSLVKYLPKEVRLLSTPTEVNYATLTPKGFIKKSIKMLFKNYKLPIKALSPILRGLLKGNMGQKKQEYWLNIKNKLPKLNEEYDVAIGVSGGTSMMYITDCVNSKKRVGWIRSDYRVLKRNNEIDRLYFKKMDKIISVSHLCKDIFVDIFPETSTKIRVMYNVLPFEMYKNIPADTSKIKKERGLYNLLTICRLDPNKGLDLAMGALEILLNKNINVKWYILGGGAYKDELQKIIKKKGLQDYFILLGFQINTAKFIENSDIVVHPSRFEGKSNVVDEAKYLLKPIVATNYETVGEQITHEKNGLIAEMNSESIAEAVLKIIRDKDLSNKFRYELLNERYNDQQSLETFLRIVDNI